jgi:hypothetical protein
MAQAFLVRPGYIACWTECWYHMYMCDERWRPYQIPAELLDSLTALTDKL